MGASILQEAIEDRARVLLFPANIPHAEKPLFFLFSLKQVLRIRRQMPVFPVPFSPPELLGVSRWHKQLIPVFSLETGLGFESYAPPAGTQRRWLILRTGDDNILAAAKARSPLRIVSLGGELKALGPEHFLAENPFVQGAYQSDEGILLVPDIKKILNKNGE